MRGKANKDTITIKIWKDDLAKAFKSEKDYDEFMDDLMNCIKDAQMDYLVKNSSPYIKKVKGGYPHK